jgi:hypothetical protein
LFNSNLRLWLNRDYFLFQKLNAMLGYDYVISRSIGNLPDDAKILLVSDTAASTQFINYYMLPRSLYIYPKTMDQKINNESDVKKVPSAWMKERGIEYIFIYRPQDRPPLIKIFNVNTDTEKNK